MGVPLLINIVEADLPLRVRRREDLAADPDVAVVLGEAPDGLPLIMRVHRRASVAHAVLGALGYPSQLEPEIDRTLAALESAVQLAARSAGVVTVRGTRLYQTQATVGALFGDPMLARLLGAQSPLIIADDRFQPSSRPERIANTAAIAHAPSPVTLMKGLATKRHVVVPLRSGPAFLAEEGESGLEPESLLPLRFEDLRSVPSARFHGRGGRDCDGSLADEDAYLRAVRDNHHVGWSIGANDVARLIAQLARSLTALHEEGRVHADVKPANTVITAGGAVAIDPIGVRVGEVSPGATPGWAAPEQILARPVNGGTDVYPLGLLMARLLGTAIHGEERSFLVPIGRGECRRVRILADPDVFVDPIAPPGVAGEQEGWLPEKIRDAWQDFLRQCVAFDPDDRPESAALFADQIEELLADAPLEWSLSLQGGPGELRRAVDVLGALQPSWVISDHR